MINLNKFQKLTFSVDCHRNAISWLQFFQSSDPHKISPHPFPSGTEEDRQASLSSLYMAGNPHASSVWPRFGPGRFRSNAFGYSRVYRVRSSVLTVFFSVMEWTMDGRMVLPGTFLSAWDQRSNLDRPVFVLDVLMFMEEISIQSIPRLFVVYLAWPSHTEILSFTTF